MTDHFIGTYVLQALSVNRLDESGPMVKATTYGDTLNVASVPRWLHAADDGINVEEFLQLPRLTDGGW